MTPGGRGDLDDGDDDSRQQKSPSSRRTQPLAAYVNVNIIHCFKICNTMEMSWLVIRPGAMSRTGPAYDW